MIRETPNMANDTLLDMSQRPRGRHSLFDNTTMWSSWIDAEFGDIEQNFKDHKRIIHQTRLVMPHPGVYSAATDPEVSSIWSRTFHLSLYAVRNGVYDSGGGHSVAALEGPKVLEICSLEAPQTSWQVFTDNGMLIENADRTISFSPKTLVESAGTLSVLVSYRLPSTYCAPT